MLNVCRLEVESYVHEQRCQIDQKQATDGLSSWRSCRMQRAIVLRIQPESGRSREPDEKTWILKLRVGIKPIV